MDILSIIKRVFVNKYIILFLLTLMVVVFYNKSLYVSQPVWVTTGMDPSLSPNGERIVFTRITSDGKMVAIVNVDGTQERILATSSNLNVNTLWFSDNEVIIVDGIQFRVFNVDTLKQNLLADIHFNNITFSPVVISASKSKLAFIQYKEAMRRIHVYDLVSQELLSVEPPTDWDCYSPTFSPNAHWLLYQCLNDTKSETSTQVWITNLTTMNSELVTTEGYYNSFSWSPDGSWIAFTTSGCAFEWLGCSNIGLIPVKDRVPNFDSRVRLFIKGQFTAGDMITWASNNTISYSANSKKYQRNGIWVATLPK